MTKRSFYEIVFHCYVFELKQEIFQCCLPIVGVYFNHFLSSTSLATGLFLAAGLLLAAELFLAAPPF